MVQTPEVDLTNMRRVFQKLVCLGVCFVVFSSCEQSVDGLGIQLKLEKRTLSNGLVVIMVENHTVPLVSYQTWFRVGSVDEHPGITEFLISLNI